jgi:hypothetical protein
MLKPVIQKKQLTTIEATELLKQSFFEKTYVSSGDISGCKIDDLSLERFI